MKELLNAIITYLITEKERTMFFLFEACFLILVCYDNHVDCYFKKSYYSGIALLKVELVKLLGLPKEDEVAVRVARVNELEKKVVLRRKYLAGVKVNFVQKCQEAASLEDSLLDTKAVIDGLSQKIEDVEAEWRVIEETCQKHFASHFVTKFDENESLTIEVARI